MLDAQLVIGERWFLEVYSPVGPVSFAVWNNSRAIAD